MIMERTIEFYRASNDKCPTEDFLDTIKENTLIKILATFKLVETLDNVPQKYLKKITGTKLFEIRVEWQSNIYRFPCFFQKNKIVIVTHGFQKKTQKLPTNEILKAKKYMEDYIMRSK